MKEFDSKHWTAKWNRKFQNKLYDFKRFITTRGFFQDMLQTYVVEELKGTICIRHIDNPKKVIDRYESVNVPQKGSYIMLGIYSTKKYYKIKKVVYCSPNGAQVYVKDVKKEENKKYLL
jgi:hypothetical protein